MNQHKSLVLIGFGVLLLLALALIGVVVYQ